MFTKVDRTDYPPQNKPLLVWDGDCGFCKYWVIKLKWITGDSINFEPYQNSAADFEDLDVSLFREASRLIETDGLIYSGPDSFYRSLIYTPYNRYKLHHYYHKYSSFRFISNHAYSLIAKHRNFMFKVSKFIFGKNP